MKYIGLLFVFLLSLTVLNAQENTTVSLNHSTTEASYIDATVYPNPSNGYFSLKLENDLPYKVEVYSMSGSLVFMQEHIQDRYFKIDLRGQLSRGMYHVRITQDQNAVIKKITIH